MIDNYFLILQPTKLQKYISVGAGSTPLHYAACGGNLKCCQARIWYLRLLRTFFVSLESNMIVCILNSIGASCERC